MHFLSIQELAHELGEDPEEIQDGEANDRNAFVKREHARMEARARIEEDLFTRVPLTKQERKRQAATTRNISSIAAIGDFGDDVADLVERAQELDELPSNDRKRRLVDVVQDGNRSMPIGIKSGRRDTGEEDVPLRDTLGVRLFFFPFCFWHFSLLLFFRHHHIEASISPSCDLSLSNLMLK
jgi:U3 small nucleolar RNA-associated protein 3